MGYIYIRQHESYDKYNCCKLGYTDNIKERDKGYVTGEIIRGKFTHVYKFSKDEKDIKSLESELKKEFSQHNYLRDGGIEFFNKIIIYLIEPYFIRNEISYKKLTEAEIDELSYKIRENKIEPFNFRYGQKEAYDKFSSILNKENYWGILIAPTGWGKGMMYYLFIGLFFSKYDKNVIFITKRKDILENVISEIDETIDSLKRKGMFPDKDYKVIDQVKNNFNPKEFNKYNKHTIVVVNSDKLITKNNDNQKEFNRSKLDKINLENFGLILFDESHWSGANRICQVMNYFKNKINFCIGCSATPIRTSAENQKNIKGIFGEDYEILHEISYKDAWDNNVILKVDTTIFPIKLDQSNINKLNNESLDDIKKSKLNKEIISNSKKEILCYFNKTLENSYRKKSIFYFSDRLSLLHWYSFIIKENHYGDYSHHMSFSYSTAKTDKINGIDKEKKSLDHQVNKKLYELKIDNNSLDDGITDFKKQQEKSILYVVGRANEGFNDPLVDICVNLDFSKGMNMLLTLQKMGRTQRIEKNKKKGYYICPIVCRDIEEFKNNLVKSIFDYIKITSELSKNSNYNKNRNHIELIRKVIETFKVEGKIDFTHDDIMVRIKLLEDNRDYEKKIHNILISQNKKRYQKNEELIDTKKKCLKFFKRNNINFEPNTQNWIKYCLGNKLFETIIQKYYYNKEEIVKACKKLDIYDYEDYKKLHNKDIMLPSNEYINNGFYIDMDPKFNLTKLLESNCEDFDF